MPPSEIRGTPASRVAEHSGDGSDLRNPRAAHHASGANRARSDSHFDSVGAQAIKSRAPSYVATLPAISSTSGIVCFIALHRIHYALAVTVRRIDHDDVYFSAPVPGHAPGSRRSSRLLRPRASALASFAAFGYFSFFWMSFTVIKPLSAN